MKLTTVHLLILLFTAITAGCAETGSDTGGARPGAPHNQGTPQLDPPPPRSSEITNNGTSLDVRSWNASFDGVLTNLSHAVGDVNYANENCQKIIEDEAKLMSGEVTLDWAPTGPLTDTLVLIVRGDSEHRSNGGPPITILFKDLAPSSRGSIDFFAVTAQPGVAVQQPIHVAWNTTYTGMSEPQIRVTNCTD